MPRPRTTLVVLLLLATTSCAQSNERELLYDQKSQFNHIQVRRAQDGLVTLIFADSLNPATQTALYPDRPHDLILPYAKAMAATFLFQPQPKRVLIIGLGGGALPSFLRKHYPDTHVTVVELDPKVIEVAKQFFGFKEDEKLKAVAGDGRKFIETTDQAYDLIILDAYGPDSIPKALATREFLEAVKKRLADGGIVASNIPGPINNDLYDEMIRTYQVLFPELHVIKAPEPSVQQTVVAFPIKAQIKKTDLVEGAQRLGARLKLKFDLAEVVRSGYRSAPSIPSSTRVLRDSDKN
jgi:spermidine synthase